MAQRLIPRSSRRGSRAAGLVLDWLRHSLPLRCWGCWNNIDGRRGQVITLLMMDQSTEAIYKLCALIALLGLASPRDNRGIKDWQQMSRQSIQGGIFSTHRGIYSQAMECFPTSHQHFNSSQDPRPLHRISKLIKIRRKDTMRLQLIATIIALAATVIAAPIAESES